jgi:hypothetical protein
MATPPQPAISRIQQTTNFTSAGDPQISFVVSFKVGEHGPFSITIPAAEFTAVEALKRVNEFAATIVGITTPPGA